MDIKRSGVTTDLSRVGDALLDLDRAPHRVDSACELDQGTIADELDYPTAVLGGPGLDQCLGTALSRACVPVPSLPISRCIQHVGGEDRGELAFEFLPDHGTAF